MAQGDQRGSSLRMRMVAGKGTSYSLLEKCRVMVTVFGSSVGQRENNAALGPLAFNSPLATADNGHLLNFDPSLNTPLHI